jgi:uncharacterized FlaG/YvyC family protein
MSIEKLSSSASSATWNPTTADVSNQDNLQARRAISSALRKLDLPELRSPDRSFRIEFDRDTRQLVVKIQDRATGEMILQIPGPDVLARLKHYQSSENFPLRHR